MKLISKYSEAVTPFIFGVLLLFTVFMGQRLLGDKADVAVLAAFTTLFGVSLNHLVQVVGQRKREKDKREFEVRRDIYLDFAEGLAKNWGRLSKLLRFDLEEKDIQTSPNEFIAAGNKVRVVASESTLTCFEKLFTDVTKFELSIRQDRFAISARINEIKQIDDQFNKNQETMTQISAYLQNMKPSGVFGAVGGWTAEDKAQIQKLQAQWTMLNNQNTSLVATKATKSQELVNAEISYRKKYIGGITELRPVTVEMLLSVRAELGIEIDADWYRKLAADQDTDMKQIMERVIDEAANRQKALQKPTA